MKRQLRTRLDLLLPSVKDHVQDKQARQQQHHDQKTQTRVIEVGQLVLARNFREGPRWLQGRVVSKEGPVSYKVEVSGQIWNRHIDQLLLYRGKDNGPEVAGGKAVVEVPEVPEVIQAEGAQTGTAPSIDHPEPEEPSEVPPDDQQLADDPPAVETAMPDQPGHSPTPPSPVVDKPPATPATPATAESSPPTAATPPPPMTRQYP